MIPRLSPERLWEEALRAHRALLRYGAHDPTCPQSPDQDLTDPCDCGLDAARLSPFTIDGVSGSSGETPDTRDAIDGKPGVSGTDDAPPRILERGHSPFCPTTCAHPCHAEYDAWVARREAQ